MRLSSAAAPIALAASLCAGSARATGHVVVEPDASFRGEDESDLLCAAVHAGDLNGDGWVDLVLGAPLHTGLGANDGKIYVFFGQLDRWTRDVDASEADVSYSGEHEGDCAGFGLAGVGDLDGDGLGDLAVGSEGNDDGGMDAGKIYVIYGEAGLAAGEHSLADVPSSLVGEWPGDMAGVMISGIGDVNGDQLDDLAITAPYNVEGGKEAGQAYVVLGSVSRIPASVDLGVVDASFLGQPRDQLGFRMSGSGDLDGDGLADLVLGATGFDAGRGRILVVFGHTTGWEMDTYVSGVDTSYHGEFSEDYLGARSAIAGDMDGDGLDDLVIGAPGNDTPGDDRGRVYLLYGRTHGWAADGPIQDHADVIFDGESANDRLGGGVVAAGDFNGDGLSDFAASATWSDHGGSDAGQAYLVLGRVSGWEEGTFSMHESDASVLGEADGDHLGTYFEGGDLDGDGYADLLYSAPYNGDSHDDAGQVYVLYGTPCWDVDWDGHDPCIDDCDDNDALTYAGAPEQCDGRDNDCDGTVDEHTDEDQDADGYTECEGDCDDADPALHPGAEEIADEVDNDCDGDIDEGLGDDDDDAGDDDAADDDLADDDDSTPAADDDDDVPVDDDDPGTSCACGAGGSPPGSALAALLLFAFCVGRVMKK